jgi:hypothetical protein
LLNPPVKQSDPPNRSAQDRTRINQNIKTKGIIIKERLAIIIIIYWLIFFYLFPSFTLFLIIYLFGCIYHVSLFPLKRK